jgi:O-antigen/teichoic acid export membrane protein
MRDEPLESPQGEQPSAAWRAFKNASYALVEFAWPIGVALLVTPVVVNGLGPSAFGVLSLIAVTLGFFGLLDLGLGGAAMRALAQRAEWGDFDAASRILGTAVTAYLVIGVVGAIAIALVTPLLVSQLLSIPVDLEPDARVAFYLSAVGFPVSLVVGALASAPKALQRFDLSTRVAVVSSTASPLVTATLVTSGYGLPAIAAATLAINVFMAFIYYRVSRHLLGGRAVRLGIDWALLRELAHFGSWFVVASIGVTILYQADKLILGAILGVAAVTYYVVPGSLANRIQGAVGAAAQLVFPASSALFARGRQEALVRLYREATRLTFLLAAALGVPMALFSEPFLTYWLGPGFAIRSTVVMIVLVGTYVLLGMTSVAWGFAFGSGRAKVNALFVLGMGALDVGLMLILVGPYGIVGAAAAYLISAAIGVPALNSYVERRVVGLSGHDFLLQYGRAAPAVGLQVAAGLGLRVLAGSLASTLLAMAATAVALPVLYLLLGLTTAEDRALLRQLVRRVRQRQSSR